MLDLILGSKNAQKLFLYLYHHGEAYPSAVANDMKISLSAIQRQCDRFEEAGIIISKLQGRTRVYSFNQRNSSFVKPFTELVKVVYDSLSIDEKEKLFPTRRRPRAKDKKVIR